jgi:hypothetical protein
VSCTHMEYLLLICDRFNGGIQGPTSAGKIYGEWQKYSPRVPVKLYTRTACCSRCSPIRPELGRCVGVKVECWRLFTPPGGLSYFRLLRRTIAPAKRLPAPPSHLQTHRAFRNCPNQSNTMASSPLVLPSARIYVGPGDRLFGYDRIWVVVYAGLCKGEDPDRRTPRDFHIIEGRHGEESRDLELLSDVLRLSSKGTASA